jgi:N-glycosylase/DNA lyase
VNDYDLSATLTSGQVFAWENSGENWIGVVSGRWVKLIPRSRSAVITAQTATPQTEWSWLTNFLQCGINLGEVLATFPTDPDMCAAIDSCRGLRLLRQDPWECLAAFILSSTKQIVQIRQIVAISARGSDRPSSFPRERPAFAFPSAPRLADATEAELRGARWASRAPYLLAACARSRPGNSTSRGCGKCPSPMPGRTSMPGVGGRLPTAFCCSPDSLTAFPIDVWVAKALRKYYFRGRRVRAVRLRNYVTKRFGPNAGYAQQYLFHYIRTKDTKTLSP